MLEQDHNYKWTKPAYTFCHINMYDKSVTKIARKKRETINSKDIAISTSHPMDY